MVVDDEAVCDATEIIDDPDTTNHRIEDDNQLPL